MQKPPNFRSEIKEIVLGHYDLVDKFVVNLGLHIDPSSIAVTLEHERLHQRLNKTSSFGLLIETAARRARNTGESRDIEFLETLISHCDLVHEMLATYGSIVLLGRYDLVSNLPKADQFCFSEMAQIASCFPRTKHWQHAASFHLCRIAMLTRTCSDFKDLFDLKIDSSRIDLSEMNSPNIRIQRIKQMQSTFDFFSFRRRMKDWGASDAFLDAFESSEDEEFITKNAGTDYSDWPNVLDNFNFFVMHAFLDEFEVILPGINETHGDTYLVQFAKSLSRTLDFSRQNDSHLGINAKVLDQLLDLCNQTICVFDGTVIPNYISDSSLHLEALIEGSIRRLNTLFLFFPRGSTEKKRHSHLTHVSQMGLVDHYILSNKEFDDLIQLEAQIVTILELTGPTALLSFESLANRISNEVELFGKINENPIEFLRAPIVAGKPIEWYAFRLGYQNSPFAGTGGLQMCMYWISGVSRPLFHLSNEMMTNAIFAFENVISSGTGALRRISTDEVFSKTSPDLVSKLVDHPVFNYYLIGRSATSVLG